MTDPVPGPLNLITDVAGLSVGGAEDSALRTGVTVLLADRQVPAAADVRGGGPGTRETEALRPEGSVAALDAVVLSGGSALGLGAADAVADALSRRGRGVSLFPDHPTVPIVPAAILYDLGPHLAAAFAAEGPPHRALARVALEAAGARFALGSHGAGRGARAGRLKGGLGSASLVLPGAAADGGPLTVGALVAANPVGSVVMPGGRAFWAWPFELEHAGRPEFGGLRPDMAEAGRAAEPLPDESRLGAAARPGGATVIAAVATDATLDAAGCLRLAIAAQDGIARAVRPAHTPMDGDTVFALATGRREAAGPRPLALARLGAAAADCLARAIARAVFEARSCSGEAPAWADC